jgi:hypothetical protein
MLVRDKDGKDIGVVKFMSGRNEAAVKLKRPNGGGAHMIFVGKDYIKGSAENASDNGHMFPKNWVENGKLHTPNGVVCDLAAEFKPPYRIEA